MVRPAPDLATLLGSHIRDVPDFPRPGILFKDINPLLADAAALAATVDALAATVADRRVEAVLGIEARGLILGAPVAYALHSGFVPVRKRGKMPGETQRASYSLEYGNDELEIPADALAAGDGVLIIDDVLATGGTLCAAIELAHRAGARVLAVAVLLELDSLGGRPRVESALAAGAGVVAAGELTALLHA